MTKLKYLFLIVFSCFTGIAHQQKVDLGQQNMIIDYYLLFAYKTAEHREKTYGICASQILKFLPTNNPEKKIAELYLEEKLEIVNDKLGLESHAYPYDYMLGECGSHNKAYKNYQPTEMMLTFYLSTAHKIQQIKSDKKAIFNLPLQEKQKLFNELTKEVHQKTQADLTRLLQKLDDKIRTYSLFV